MSETGYRSCLVRTCENVTIFTGVGRAVLVVIDAVNANAEASCGQLSPASPTTSYVAPGISVSAQGLVAQLDPYRFGGFLHENDILNVACMSNCRWLFTGLKPPEPYLVTIDH